MGEKDSMKNREQKIIIIFLTIVTILPVLGQTETAAPPPSPKTYSTTLESDYSVYVSQEQPTKNFNSGTNKYYLNIQQNEFEYKDVSLVKFDLSTLPDDADILDAEIRLYLTADPSSSAAVNMYPIREAWIENDVTWNSKPSYKDFTKTQGLIDSITISTDGWKEWDAASIVEDWIDGTRTNYGVAFETNENLPRFRSDDSSYKPRIWILYKSSSGEEPEDPPEEPPEDTTACEISYTITPENPQNGDEVTISAIATDDVGLEYLTIKEGSIERCTSFAEDDATKVLYCNYSETLFTPGKSFFIEANDLGSSSTQLISLDITVEGSGTNPEVTLSIEFDEEDAIPEKHRILPMDGQQIEITATASDPDGINLMTLTYDGMPYDFSYDPPATAVEETLTLINGIDFLDDCTVPCTFRYSLRAYDVEGRSTQVEGEDIELGAPWQWYWGLPFANWGCDENHTWSWSMMESIFGDEIWWNKDRGWKKPHAEYLYNNKIKEGGRGGQCYGMCALSLELSQSSTTGLYANLIQPTAASIDDLDRENWNNTWPYYYARQAGQYSFHRLLLKSAQYLLQPERSGSGLHPFIDGILDDIIDDLNAGTPGIISIFEGGSGHAVVPWRVVPLGSDIYNVYIYDPNHAYTSTHDSTDYTNFNQYPFIVFGEDGWGRDGWWSYEWNSTSTWNENIYYTPYDTVIGDPSVKNYIGISPTTVAITDQRLPDPMQTLMFGSGDASFYAEDSSGRKTGYVNGDLVAEIPYSAPIHESDDGNGTVDMFMLPSNVTLTIHTESTVESNNDEGTYSLMLWHNSSFYSIENVANTKDTKDEITFMPLSTSDENIDHSLRFLRGDVTKLRASDPLDYTIHFAKEFYNSPFIGREYIFTSGQNNEGAEIELSVSEDHDDFVVETFDTPFTFTVTTKSTESVDNDSQIDYIPESKGNFSMDANEKMAITPDDWATTSAAGSFNTGEEQDDDSTDGKESDTPGFELFALLLALIAGMIWYKKKKQQ